MSDRPRFYTVAQLASRVGLSDGRVRAMWAESKDSLPTPDAFDAADRAHPLWLAPTIDRWWELRSKPKTALVNELIGRADHA